MGNGRKAVLIIGKMRAGKTTAADILVEQLGFTKFSLANKLKDLYAASHSTLYATISKPKKDREWLQTMGQAARTVFGEDFWVDELIKDIYNKFPDNWVVDDIRYENELNRLKEYAYESGWDVTVLYIDIDVDSQIARGGEIHLIDDISEEFPARLRDRIYFGADHQWYFLDSDLAYISIIDGSTPLDTYRDLVLKEIES